MQLIVFDCVSAASLARIRVERYRPAHDADARQRQARGLVRCWRDTQWCRVHYPTDLRRMQRFIAAVLQQVVTPAT